MLHPSARKLIIVAAVEPGDEDPLVMERAIELANSSERGEVHVVTVSEPPVELGAYAMVVRDAFPATTTRTADACRSTAHRLVDEGAVRSLPTIEVHAMSGLPSEEIIWLAARLDADYIVMGTHGRRGIKRLLLGSVAERVVRLAGCPVVVVREKSHGEADRGDDADLRGAEDDRECPRCSCKLSAAEPAVRAGVEVRRCPTCLWVGEREATEPAIESGRYVPKPGSVYDQFGYARRLSEPDEEAVVPDLCGSAKV